jgi:hypothetical protein
MQQHHKDFLIELLTEEENALNGSMEDMMYQEDFDEAEERLMLVQEVRRALLED